MMLAWLNRTELRRLHEQSDDRALKLSYVTVVSRVKRFEFAFGYIYPHIGHSNLYDYSFWWLLVP